MPESDTPQPSVIPNKAPAKALSLDRLRRAAKQLRRDHEAGLADALERLRVHPPRSPGSALCHADYLHVIAQEQSFASWPALKLAAETIGLDRAALQQRLKIALAHGQVQVVKHLLQQTPDLAEGLLGAQIALYDLGAVQAALRANPAAATTPLGPRTPMAHLCYSRMHQAWPDRRADMLAIADLLLAHGGDVNGGIAGPEGHQLSLLYGALIHADNPVLAQWLLDHGADPNDGESLYHSVELGHHDGLRMLLAAGADPKGTNALLRALDFNDHAAVERLLQAGAEVNRSAADPVGGDAPVIIPALHQAARRLCDRRMIDLLLQAGADPAETWQGISAYGYARVFGNAPLVAAIEARGAVPELSAQENVLAAAAQGRVIPGARLDQSDLPAPYRNILHDILPLPGRLPHLQALIRLGLHPDLPNDQGLTPVQAAGWEGLPEVMAVLLQHGPDLSHVNHFGGTLLTTIIHGSENCPARAERDHLACLQLALEQGVALPQRAIDLAGAPHVAEFLADWALQHPAQRGAG